MPTKKSKINPKNPSDEKQKSKSLPKSDKKQKNQKQFLKMKISKE